MQLRQDRAMLEIFLLQGVEQIQYTDGTGRWGRKTEQLTLRQIFVSLVGK